MRCLYLLLIQRTVRTPKDFVTYGFLFRSSFIILRESTTLRRATVWALLFGRRAGRLRQGYLGARAFGRKAVWSRKT